MVDLSLASLLESGMLLAFGFAWPANILKSLRCRTAQGKSISFLVIVLVGYLFGIAAKLVSGTITYVLFFYILNTVMVSFDVVLYFRNRRLDRERDQNAG